MGTIEFHKKFGTRASARKHVAQLCALSESEIIAVLDLVRSRRVRFPSHTFEKSLKIAQRAAHKRLA